MPSIRHPQRPAPIKEEVLWQDSHTFHVLAREFGNLILGHADLRNFDRHQNRCVWHHHNVPSYILAELDVANHAPVSAHAAIRRVTRPNFDSRITQPNNLVKSVPLLTQW